MNKSIFLLGLLLIACDDTDKSTASEEVAASTIQSNGITVTTSIIQPQVFQKQIIANGKVEALQKSELRFKTSERIASIRVKNGQRVTKGQIIATLDNTVLTNQIQKSKIELDKAKSKFREEKINYGLANESNDNMDPEVLKTLQTKSGLFEAQNALENSQLMSGQTVLRAPFSGVIANIEAKTGNYITASDVFCTMISQQQMEVAFSVLENELPYVNLKQEVNITSFSDQEVTYRGTVTEINPLVDENGLIKIKAKINQNNASFFDGMHAKVIINQPVEEVIVIPKEALVLRSNREVVFTIEDGLAKWNYVEKLDENSTSYAIKKGLTLGDTLIVSGNINLSHDAKVNVNEDAKPVKN